MKLKEMCKRFFTLNVHDHAGFTLVELIIVIAILAILSGAAVAGYSAYVKKANMQADKTLVAEVVNALTLHYYSAQPSGDFVATVVLSGENVDAEGFAADALNAAYGSSWNSLKLKYNDWGNGAVVASSVLTYITSGEYDAALEGIYNGTQQPGYVGEIDELYDLVEYTAIGVAQGALQGVTSGAALVHGAAGVTTGEEAKGLDAFISAWKDSAGSFIAYFGDAGEGVDAAAYFGAIKARNVAIASYVRTALSNQAYSSEVCNAVYNMLINYNSGTYMPHDLGLAVSKEEENAKFEDAFLEKMNDMDLYSDTCIEIDNYFAAAIAETDAKGYYGMLSAIDATSDSTSQTDDVYWKDMSSAIDVYKAALAGVALDDMAAALGNVNGNSIAVVMYVQNGEITFVVSPQEAKAE